MGTTATQQYYSGAAYLIYGINGGYRSNATLCPNYPCTIQVTNAPGNVPDYTPTKVVENVDNSCDPTSNSCNVLRFIAKLPSNYYYYHSFGDGTLATGDLTGDSFSEVAVSSGGDPWQTWSRVYIFSGAQTGLVTAAYASTQPVCTGTVCSPFYFEPPNNPVTQSYVAQANMDYRVSPISGGYDVDHDGKKDFLISSRFLHSPLGGGFWTGGFFLYY
jgi:hypothetical protein